MYMCSGLSRRNPELESDIIMKYGMTECRSFSSSGMNRTAPTSVHISDTQIMPGCSSEMQGKYQSLFGPFQYQTMDLSEEETLLEQMLLSSCQMAPSSIEIHQQKHPGQIDPTRDMLSNFCGDSNIDVESSVTLAYDNPLTDYEIGEGMGDMTFGFWANAKKNICQDDFATWMRDSAGFDMDTLDSYLVRDCNLGASIMDMQVLDMDSFSLDQIIPVSQEESEFADFKAFAFNSQTPASMLSRSADILNSSLDGSYDRPALSNPRDRPLSYSDGGVQILPRSEPIGMNIEEMTSFSGSINSNATAVNSNASGRPQSLLGGKANPTDSLSFAESTSGKAARSHNSNIPSRPPSVQKTVFTPADDLESNLLSLLGLPTPLSSPYDTMITDHSHVATNSSMIEFFFKPEGVTAELRREVAKILFLRISSGRYLKLLQRIITQYDKIKRIEATVHNTQVCNLTTVKFWGDSSTSSSAPLTATSSKELFKQTLQPFMKAVIDNFQKKYPISKKARLAKMDERSFIQDVYFSIFQAESKHMKAFFEVLARTEGVINISTSDTMEPNGSFKIERHPAIDLIQLYRKHWSRLRGIKN